jgi:16S rRNA (adenine1518-N6/adenine1519-N6)-dimethyltransferase
VSLPAPGELVREYGRAAKKRYGQNFLVDAGILDRIVALARVGEGTRVLEIGPGPGGLTSRLLAAGADVVAIELDREAAEFVGAQLGPFGLQLVVGDALDPAVLDAALGAPPRSVVANLPYYAATEILFRLLDHSRPPDRMTLMFQREVAERIVGTQGESFGTVALAVAFRFEARIAMTLAPGAFIPPPKVRSSVVVFEKRAVPLATAEVETEARRLASFAFKQRRKMLRNPLALAVADAPTLFDRSGISGERRAEEIGVDGFIALAKASLSAR